jgi:hypothetical protein
MIGFGFVIIPTGISHREVRAHALRENKRVNCGLLGKKG